jgi:hypothetical protein
VSQGGHDDPGELLDRALARLGVRWTAGFDPRTYRPQAVRPWGLAWRTAAAAAVLLLGVFAESLGQGTGTRHAALSVSSLGRLSPASPVSASTPWPLWPSSKSAAWPVVVQHRAASRVSQTIVSAGPVHRPVMNVVFVGNRPIAAARGSKIRIRLRPTVGRTQSGRWVVGGYTVLDSLAAAGNYTYLTEGRRWAVLGSPAPSTWNSVPDPTASWSWIQALPDAPATAVLLTADSGGQQGMFWRSSVRGAWHAEPLPGSPVTQLVAAGRRFWALAGGRLVVSQNGHTWTALFSPPAGFTVTTFAVDPVGRGEVALALAPDGGAGVGPMMASWDGGRTWTTLPAAWPTGGRPVTLVLDPRRDVSALFGPPGPIVLERWVAGSRAWVIVPLPPRADVARVGELAALSQGNLVYADARGRLFLWTVASGRWHPLPPPPLPMGSVSLLMGIGPRQVLAAYPSGWGIFVMR